MTSIYPAFGSWVASAKFDDDWSLSRLVTALQIAGTTDDAVERMVVLVENYPSEVVECLELLVKSDLDSWWAYSWGSNAEIMLSKALATDAAENAGALIHHLGSRGYREFRKPLKAESD